MILIAFPRASRSQARVAVLVQLLDRLELVVALRIALVGRADAVGQHGIPPASSIFIAIDVPERGSPETTTIGWPVAQPPQCLVD